MQACADQLQLTLDSCGALARALATTNEHVRSQSSACSFAHARYLMSAAAHGQQLRRLGIAAHTLWLRLAASCQLLRIVSSNGTEGLLAYGRRRLGIAAHTDVAQARCVVLAAAHGQQQ